MKYLCLIYEDETLWHSLPKAEVDQLYAEYAAFKHGLKQSGQLVGCNPLQPTPCAVTVRVRNGTVLITDGPFAETKEQLGGYFLIDAKDLDEALAIAARIPMVRKGTVEVRPVIEIPGLPNEA
jgi:hypothetical protein